MTVPGARALRRSATGVLVLLLLALAGIGVFSLTLPRDDLTVLEPAALGVAEDARGRWEVGPLTVTVASDGVTVAEGERVVWRSPAAGTAFLSAASGEVSVTEHRGYFWPEVSHDTEWTEQRIDSVRVAGDRLRLAGTLTGGDGPLPWTATLGPRPGGGAVLTAEVAGADAVALASGRSEGAGVHGFGEQFDDFDLDGRLVPILVREQGVGRGLQPLTLLADLTNRSAGGDSSHTYAAWSSYVTDDLRGLALDPDEPASHAFTVADTRDPARVTLQVWAPTVAAELTAADTPAELVEARHAGGPTLPGWADDGAVVGIQGGTREVRRRVADLQAAGAALAGVWLQDWTGQRTTSFGDRLWWTWQLDERRYPGWERLVSDLAREGIRVTTYVNPFLVDADDKDAPGLRNLYDEAADRGHLVRRQDGSPYLLDQGGFDAALVDLTNPRARAWFTGVIAEEVLGAGVAGFMADFGEGLPFDAVLHQGDAAQAHNRWPGLWARTVRDACARAGRPDCLTWFRAGSLGMGEDASLFWNGDQLVHPGREDGLASALLGTFSAGVSGWPLVHSDVGGYTSVDAVVTDYVRSEELLARWAEMQAFGVMMRSHEGNRPDANPQVYDAGSRDSFAEMSRVFAALEPYRTGVLAQARSRGLPAVRHGWLAAPGTDAAEVDTQFFLGDAVLVAPVLEEGEDSVEVTLPPGRWRHLVTGEVRTAPAGGGALEVAAPLGRPAAFVRADHPMAGRLVREVSAALR